MTQRSSNPEDWLKLAHKYARKQLRERTRDLAVIDLERGVGLVSTDEYQSSLKSLLIAIRELRTIRGVM
jgi:hypothetical protein